MRRFAFSMILVALIIAACATPESSNDEPNETAGPTNETAGPTADEAGTPGPEADEEELPVVRITSNQGGNAEVFARFIEEEGLDTKHGFQGEFSYLDLSAASQAFLQGESDIGMDIDLFTAALARSEGRNVTLFTGLSTLNTHIVVPEDSPYQEPEDLLGARVGHFGLNSGTTSTFALILDKFYDIDVFEDYELIEAPPPALTDLLAEGELDAMFNFSPHVSRSVVEGGGRVLLSAFEPDHLPLPYAFYLAAYDEWLEENEELARGVAAAAEEAMTQIVESDFEVLREEPYASIYGLDEAVMDEFLREAREQPLFLPGEWDEEQVDGQREIIEDFAERNIILEEVPEGDVVTTLDAFYGDG